MNLAVDEVTIVPSSPRLAKIEKYRIFLPSRGASQRILLITEKVFDEFL